MPIGGRVSPWHGGAFEQFAISAICRNLRGTLVLRPNLEPSADPFGRRSPLQSGAPLPLPQCNQSKWLADTGTASPRGERSDPRFWRSHHLEQPSRDSHTSGSWLEQVQRRPRLSALYFTPEHSHIQKMLYIASRLDADLSCELRQGNSATERSKTVESGRSTTKVVVETTL